VLFGAGKIPRIAKDLGSGIREFKKSIKDEKDDEGEKK
jgi:TatA/E family protein of Tat protein translocase